MSWATGPACHLGAPALALPAIPGSHQPPPRPRAPPSWIPTLNPPLPPRPGAPTRTPIPHRSSPTAGRRYRMATPDAHDLTPTAMTPARRPLQQGSPDQASGWARPEPTSTWPSRAETDKTDMARPGPDGTPHQATATPGRWPPDPKPDERQYVALEGWAAATAEPPATASWSKPTPPASAP